MVYRNSVSSVGSGIGEVIDIALVDSQVTWLANIAGSYFATGERPPKMGNLHPTITPYQPLQARDKIIIVAVGTERLWKRFCEVLGIEETVGKDPRFGSNPERNRHRAELIGILERVLARRSAEESVSALVAEGIPAGPVNYPDQILTDPHLVERKMVVELEHPLIGVVRSIGNPINLSATGVSYRRYPPRLGEHNSEIRAELEH